MLRTTIVILICVTAIPALSQSTSGAPPRQAPIKCTEVIGIAGVKDKTEGTLRIEAGKLYFAYVRAKAAGIAAAAIEDVVTGDDSQRLIRGTPGTLSMFGPYGSGRVLSMFRSKIDSLTIKYRDDDGGLHAVVFTMPKGTAESFKQELIAHGAHTIIPAPANAGVDSSHGVATGVNP